MMDAPQRPEPLFQAIWVLWAVAFVAMEFYCAGRPERWDTLTETTCWWTSLHWTFKIGLSLFWLWLALHMLSRYWGRPIL